MPAFGRTDPRRTGKARVLTQKALWQTFRAEAKGRNAVLDTACNRTMVGERALEDLERHIEELEARGGKAPGSALRLVRPDHDSEVEDQFDNMPI